MNIRNLLPFLLLAGFPQSVSAQFILDWDKIVHWVGEGENRAAIAVQFNDGLAQETYVWGYRWSGNREINSRDMLAAIAAQCGTIEVLEQRTSNAENGYTLGGIGFSTAGDICGNLGFDFDAARNDGRITFNYYATAPDGITIIGPGDDTPRLYRHAINEAAAGSHIIQHPVDVTAYGTACRDYDHWQVGDISPSRHWNSGWNDGNWIAWIGGVDSSTLNYSGMCYATRAIKPDEVVVWNFNRHDCYPSHKDIIDGYTGASRPVRPLNYSHSCAGAYAPETTISDNSSASERIYTLSGRAVSYPLSAGFYITVDKSGNARKIRISAPQ